MNKTDWFNIIPSTLSTVATVAAAFAAFGSLRVSRDAKLFAEQSALAVHHGNAAIALTKAVDELTECTHAFSELAYRTWSNWPSEIESLDHREAGGSNARPLRHVLTDASEMLVNYGIKKGKKYSDTGRLMYSIIRSGIDNLNDVEYEKLLRKADGEYCDFEGTFGPVTMHRSIAAAPAFRWAYYQLNKRIIQEKWGEIWKNAWNSNGYLGQFRAEYANIKPTLEKIKASLELERAKLEHTAFPLECNQPIHIKYNNALDVIDALLNTCGLDMVERRIENYHEEEAIQLISYSMGVAFLVLESLGSLD